MDSSVLLAVFTGIVAAALLMQSIAFFGIHRSVRKATDRFEEMSLDASRKLDVITRNFSEFISAAKPILERTDALQQNILSTTEMIHDRARQLDEFLQESTDAARLQIARIQDVIDTTSTRIEDSIEIVQKQVLAPVGELTAIVRGVRAGLQVFFRGFSFPSTKQAHQDEEMFI